MLSLFILALLIILSAVFLYIGGSSKNNNFPGFKCRPIFIFYIYRRNVAYNPLKHISYLCLIFQNLCGLCKLFEKDSIARFWIFNKQFVFFFKPETVEVVLRNPTNIEKSSEYEFLSSWLRTGLLTSKKDKWRFRRKLLTPAFHFRILDNFLPIFHEQSQVLVSLLKTQTDKPWVDIAPYSTRCALDIICETAMGVNMNAQRGGCSEYVQALNKIGKTFLIRVFRPHLWNDTVFYCSRHGKKFKANLKLVQDFTKEVIKEKKQAMLENYSGNQELEKTADESPKKRRVFLELLLERHLADNSLTLEDIQEEVDTFMFGGHDTTSMAISWALYCLGLYPEVQEKAIRELDSIFGDDVTRPITREDLAQMKYLECVMKETLRLYPSIPFISRELTEDIKVLDYRLSPGTVCFVFTFMLHRDPESFPNPEKFDPDRFSPENSMGRHPYAYIPFSAGPRNCIGQKFAMMEEKVVVANVLRNFRVESLDQRDKVHLSPDLVTRNLEPLRIRLFERHT